MNWTKADQSRLRDVEPAIRSSCHEPNGRSMPKVSLDTRTWRGRAGATGHRGRFKRGTRLLVLCRRRSPGLFPREVLVDGLSIRRMLDKREDTCEHVAHLPASSMSTKPQIRP